MHRANTTDMSYLYDTTSGEPVPWAEMNFADWNYCEMDTNETRQDREEMIARYIQHGKNGAEEFNKC